MCGDSLYFSYFIKKTAQTTQYFARFQKKKVQIINVHNETHMYGGHSADLLFHIIISELQYIIPDSSPKISSGHEKYLLGAFIYWAAFIYSGRVYSV